MYPLAYNLITSFSRTIDGQEEMIVYVIGYFHVKMTVQSVLKKNGYLYEEKRVFFLNFLVYFTSSKLVIRKILVALKDGNIERDREG